MIKKEHRYNTIIFDLDGTLLNTIEDITDAVNYSLINNGIIGQNVSINEVKYFVGSGVDNLIKRLMVSKKLGDKYFDSLKKDYLVQYVLVQKDKTRPYDGIIDLLTDLNNSGIKIAVISNKPQDDVERIINYYFKEVKFDAIVGATPNIPIKPNPQVVYNTINLLQADIKKTLYIGDSDVDMKTAKNSNLDSIGVLWGFRTKEELEKENAMYIVSTTDEIKKIINI